MGNSACVGDYFQPQCPCEYLPLNLYLDLDLSRVYGGLTHNILTNLTVIIKIVKV